MKVRLAILYTKYFAVKEREKMKMLEIKNTDGEKNQTSWDKKVEFCLLKIANVENY